MNWAAIAPSALLAVLALAQPHGDAEAALRMTGFDHDDIQRFDGVPADRLLKGRPRATTLNQLNELSPRTRALP
jgi:hypothetical protein